MACDDVREFLADLGLNEPTRRRAAEALAHLEGCGDCRAALRDFDAISATLHALGELPAEERHATSSGGLVDTWPAVEKKLETTLQSKSAALKVPSPLGRKSLPIFRRLRISGAVAAAALLTAAGFFAGKAAFGPSASHEERSAVASLPAPSAAEVSGGVRAFNEINTVYDGQTHWVLMTQGDVEVGLPKTLGPADAQNEPQGGRLLLVRLRLLHGGDVVSDADLVIVAGQTADLAVSTKAGRSLRYRVVTSASAPDRVELRAEIRGANGGTTAEAALATDLQLRPDRAVTAGQLVTPGGAYDVAVSYGAPL